MKLKTIFILTIITSTLFSCNDSVESVFTDKTYQDTIKQNIGGLLIREIHYTEDFQSWINDIKYSYKDKFDSISNIGSGTYHAEEPPKDEQLFLFGNWTVFKTSGDRDKDLLFIYDKDKNIWNEFEISPEVIEKTVLWRNKNIDSELHSGDTVSKINKIDKDGNIIVLYIYAKKNRIFSFIRGKRQITYKINLQTGRPEMTDVREI
jgi:hypothetical protein